MKITKIVLIVVLILILGTGLYIASPNEGKRVMEQDTAFSFDLGASSVKGMPAALLLNRRNSRITLTKDGYITIKLVFNDALGLLVGNLELDEDPEFANIILMLYEYLPGLDLADLSSINRVFGGGLGITLLGLDPENASLVAMFDEVAQTGNVPSNIVIPKGFGLEIFNRYYIQDKVSPVTNIKYTGIYLGNPHPDGESFMVLDLETDSTGKQKIIMNFPLIELYLVAVEI